MKWNGLKISILIILVVVGFSRCNIFESGSTSNSMLVLESITGTDLFGNDDSAVIFSDVETNGSVFNDRATAAIQALPIDPTLDLETTTYYYNVIVDQIDVEYSRSDGLNQEGRDVPFGFSQKLNIQVNLFESYSIGFVIVQHVAKIEPPLIDLVNYGDENILKLEAKVTIHGTDLGGHRVAPVVGYISIWCANFADEQTE
jgi:hypothetical protein